MHRAATPFWYTLKNQLVADNSQGAQDQEIKALITSRQAMGVNVASYFLTPLTLSPPPAYRGNQSLLVIYRTTCWREGFVFLKTYCTSAAAHNTSCWKTCVSQGSFQIGISISSGSGEDRSDSVASPMASPHAFQMMGSERSGCRWIDMQAQGG